MSQFNTIQQDDPFNLTRFLTAQKSIYQQVLAELKNGQKRSHWIWFIFPQIEGLGKSSTSIFYAIKSEEEAQAYLNHPILSQRLLECTNIILLLKGRSASQIFGFPDDMKLKSSMTLFSAISTQDNSPFEQVLEQFFQGQRDEKTDYLLTKMKSKM